MSVEASHALNRPITVNESTQKAKTESLLTPRFYTTDFDVMDAWNLEPVRAEWDKLMDEFRNDNNRNHFHRDEAFDAEIQPLSDELYDEFINFMVSSVTSEYSGHVLYKNIVNAVDNPDIKEVMAFMARDEARHAGFINKALRDYGKQVNLNHLRANKAYKYFKPKYIMYATYLSEKIGYARYITIYRQFEKHPERRFHPMFRWFRDWCNDEFRHGEVFALMMKSRPDLLTGVNKYWIRFFLLAVYATMYVRDHGRPAMHEAMGFDPTDYDFRVFHITNECTKQIFPLTLDIDHPAFRKGLDRLVEINDAVARAKRQGGVVGLVKRAGLAVAASGTFLRLLALPVVENELPEDVRMAPSW